MATRNTSEQAELTVIGRETKISGEMHFEAGARILGEFEGRISSSGEVQIGDTATCRAQIEADSLVIDGRLEGDAVVCNRLSLNETAAVRGDLKAGTMVVTEGATYVGTCAIGPRAEELSGNAPDQGAAAGQQAEPKPRTAARQDRAAASQDDDLTPPWKRGREAEAARDEAETAAAGANGRATKAG